MIRKIKQNWLLVILFLFSLTPLIWFWRKPGIIINGLDTNFPLDPIIWFMRRFFVWNDVANAGVNFASSTAGLFFHLIQVIPYTLGASLQITQIVSLVFWFSLLTVSAYVFARKIVPGNKIARIVFVTFYVFNVYLFNTWENVKVANLAVVTSLPLFLTIFISYKDKGISKAKFIFLTALVAVVASGAGINPAYFVTILGGLVILGLVQRRVKTLFIMLAIIFLVNSFWIVSTGKQLFFTESRIATLSDIGFTNWLDSLSQNTSLINVFRLQGAWDWYAKDDAGAALYIPYANNYFRRLPFVLFSLVLPALALVGLAIKRPAANRLKIYFGLLLILGLFLGAGSHPPTGRAYQFLAIHLPLFSFFRSPWYIFTPYVTLGLAGLMALLIDSREKIFGLLAWVLVVGNLIYAYPLVTGKIFRPGRSDSFYIQFPSHVFAAKDWLTEQPLDGRIVGYPGDEIERFEWGYSGIESILNLIARNETIFSNLNATDAPIAKVVRVFYSALRRGQIEVAKALAAKLNLAIIFAKGDQGSLWDELPGEIKSYDHESFGQWGFYRLPLDKFLPKIYFPENLFLGWPNNKLEQLMIFLTAKEVLTSPQDTVVQKLPGIGELAGEILLAQNSQMEDYENYLKTALKQTQAFNQRDLGQVTYTVEINKDGRYQPLLENFLLERFGIDASEGLNVLIDGQEQIWPVNTASDLLVFDPIELKTGTHVISLKLKNDNLLASGQQILGITNREEEEKFLTFTIRPFISLQPYLIEFDYKNIYGRKSTFKVEQKSDTVNYKFAREGPPFSPEWIRFSFYFDPIPAADSYLEIKPAVFPVTDDPLGTKIEYANLAVYPVFINQMAFVRQPETDLASAAQVDFKKVSPVKYTGQVRRSQGSSVLVFSENYSPDWRIKLENIDGAPIAYNPPHFSANLYANAWFIEDLAGDYDFEIYYQPQTLHNFFLIVSAGTLVVSAGFYLYESHKRV